MCCRQDNCVDGFNARQWGGYSEIAGKYRVCRVIADMGSLKIIGDKVHCKQRGGTRSLVSRKFPVMGLYCLQRRLDRRNA